MVQGPRRARKDYSVNVRHAGLTLRTIARVANAKKLAVVALVLAEEGRRRHARDYLAEDLAMLSLAYIVKEAGKNKSIGQFEVVGKAWDHSLGKTASPASSCAPPSMCSLKSDTHTRLPLLIFSRNRWLQF